MGFVIGRGGHFTGTHVRFFESPDNQDSKNAIQKLSKSFGDCLFYLATSPILAKKRFLGLFWGKKGLKMGAFGVPSNSPKRPKKG